jgi:hypothetical protein
LKSKAYIPVVLAVTGVNIIGVVLKLLGLPAYIIIIGFRFHLSMFLPFLFIVNRLNGDLIKNEFKDPLYKRNLPFLLSFLITGIIVLVLYLLQYIEVGDPEYFYEFGLSSILDFPIYLVWNSIHLITFYLFLVYARILFKYNNAAILLLVPALFIFEFVPLEREMVNITGIAGLILTSILINILLTRFKNIYWFTTYIFVLIWSYILLFGSSYTSLINIILASQYNMWEGFYNVRIGSISDYSYLIYVFIIIIILLLFSLFNKKR